MRILVALIDFISKTLEIANKMNKHLTLALLLIAPLSSFAFLCPTPSMFKSTSEFKLVTGKVENHSYDLIGTSTAGQGPRENPWYIYSYSIPAKNSIDAIKKANNALSEGALIQESQNAYCSGNSCSCDYKILIKENSDFIVREFKTFVMF